MPTEVVVRPTENGRVHGTCAQEIFARSLEELDPCVLLSDNDIWTAIENAGMSSSPLPSPHPPPPQSREVVIPAWSTRI